jgi:hypothetical protein
MPEKLSRKQEDFIAALLASPTIEAAAKRSGISEASAHRWLKLAPVSDAYRAARRDVVDHAIALLQQSTTSAISTLLRNLKAPAPPAVQVRAAIAILEFARDGVELADLAARVDELETAIGAQSQSERFPYAS